MDYEKLKLYAFLSRFKLFRTSYLSKVMFVVLTGLLLPLLASVIYLLTTDSLNQYSGLLIVILISILFSMIIVFFLLKKLFYPLMMTVTDLHNYINLGTIPDIPIDFKGSTFKDPVGQLMADVRYLTQKLSFTTKSLNESSNIDPLTNISNRQAAEERLRQDIARANRHGNRILIAVIDIDDFKGINEQYGHQVGDVCLIHIAEVISKNIRAGDWLARWGGDEFLMILWNINEDTLTKVLERVQRHSVKTAMGELLEISFSIAAYKHRLHTDLDTALECLGEALYKVKEEGRGSIVVVE